MIKSFSQKAPGQELNTCYCQGNQLPFDINATVEIAVKKVCHLDMCGSWLHNILCHLSQYCELEGNGCWFLKANTQPWSIFNSVN